MAEKAAVTNDCRISPIPLACVVECFIIARMASSNVTSESEKRGKY